MKSISLIVAQIKRVFKVTYFFTQYTLKKLIYSARFKLPILNKIHVKSFPAIHIKKMDTWDYLLTFSSEITIFTIAFFIASLNFYFFTLKTNTPDNSLASTLLSYHHKDGDKVYGKLASIKTVVENNNSHLIQEAFAESAPFLEAVNSDEDEADPDNFVLNENNTLVRPNPDSVSALIAKQVKVHTVAQGETLGSIAKKYGISTDTLIWANKLPSAKVQVGWQLLVLPTDAILVKADSNTTLPDIAFKYKCSLDTIISYNGLDGADDIEEGRIIIAPGCKIQPPKTVAKPNTSNSKPGTKSTPAKQLGKHIFPLGYCTYYVATRMEIDFGGNANVWHINAAKAGYETGNVPRAGSAAVTTDGPRRYGHVVYVEKVTDSYIEVSEMNFKGWNKKSTRRIPLGSKSIVKYIYPK